ncbi:hypothetical protein D9611_011518 [Ephemerocybe angulata]|uniref:Uncharacterized protein n=1 Tax=Ephemerocybe angulata TaxID=980116 RepID=A0A8H5CE78_9AGAR|nr:hypothetical protein D9611_011518 [Tulosesus angulatus]
MPATRSADETSPSLNNATDSDAFCDPNSYCIPSSSEWLSHAGSSIHSSGARINELPSPPTSDAGHSDNQNPHIPPRPGFRTSRSSPYRRPAESYLSMIPCEEVSSFSPSGPVEPEFLEEMIENLLQCGVVEERIGRVVCSLLDLVGQLVVLNRRRGSLNSRYPRSTRNAAPRGIHVAVNALLSRLSVWRRVADSLLHLRFPYEDSSPPLQFGPTSSRLTQSQLRQLGSRVSLNPDIIYPIIWRMWATESIRPDFTGVLL